MLESQCKAHHLGVLNTIALDVLIILNHILHFLLYALRACSSSFETKVTERT